MTDITPPETPAPVFFVTHSGATQTKLGSVAFGPVPTEVAAQALAKSLARGRPAMIYQATILATVAPIVGPAPAVAPVKPVPASEPVPAPAAKAAT